VTEANIRKKLKTRQYRDTVELLTGLFPAIRELSRETLEAEAGDQAGDTVGPWRIVSIGGRRETAVDPAHN
jgi:hypothetical protein